MCGRFYYGENIDVTPYVRILERDYDQTILNLWCHGEVTPDSVCLVLTPDDRPMLMRWGYQAYGHAVINTRLESLGRKAVFDEDFEHRRCVIPASGFYEWNPAHERFFITPSSGAAYLAGLYQPAAPLDRFSIITKPATGTRAIHDRAPVVLDRQQALAYLADRAQALILAQGADPRLDCQAQGAHNLSLF